MSARPAAGPGGTRRPRPVLPVLLAPLLLLVPLLLPASGTDGAWHDTEHVAAGLAVRMPRDCGTDGRYASEARAQVLSGRLGTTDLATVAGLAGLRVVDDGTTSSPDPATALPAGPDAWRDPLGATAVAGLVAADLSGALQLSAPGQAAGVLAQHARATGDGEAQAGAGAVSSSGAVLAGASGAGGATLPGPATLDLAALAPGAAGLAGARLEVGALAAGARLDGCARDEGLPWLVREHAVAGLVLVAGSPAAATLRTTAATAASTAGSSVAALQTELATTAASTLLAQPGLLGGTLQSSTATVAVDVPGVVAPFLGQRLDDGVVSVDLATATVRVDLAALAGGLALPPGTALGLDAVAPLVAARVDALLATWSAAVVAAVDTALRAAAVTVDVRVSVPLVGTQQVRLTGTVAQVLAGTATVTAPLGLGAVAAPLLAGLGPLVQLRLFAPGGTLPVLAGSVAAAVPAVGTTAGALVAATRAAVALVLGVHRQPAGSGTATTADDAWSVTALQVRVLAGTRAGSTVDLATATVGPVRELP